MLERELMVVMCDQLAEEWRNHRSAYSRRWLGAMTARKRVVRIKPDQIVMRAIERHLTDKDEIIARKDAHLVDAALCSQALVASNDSAARQVFQRASVHFGAIRGIIWFVPRLHEELLGDILKPAANTMTVCCLVDP
ncbi:hypothetical protein BVZ31_14625 [Alcaligenes faecalis]|nr:hypothetical protein BVZ30_17200 [Alcaligenes faecalis]OSZ48708.1 hypothetical protein BVZ31_14625 [Alcaligenes faecalis]